MLDPYYRVITPEGVELVMIPAGPARRAQAWLFDFLLRMIAQAVIGIPLLIAMPGAAAVGINLIFNFVLGWFYPVFFEVQSQGMTPGKRWAGLQVSSSDGSPVSWRASVIRNLLRTVDMLPSGYAAGLICMLIDGHFRRIGDLAAGTLVVYRPQPTRRGPALKETPIPLPIALSTSEQRLLIDLAERAPRLPPQRVLELADLAEPLTRRTGAAGWARLKAHIAYLTGVQR